MTTRADPITWRPLLIEDAATAAAMSTVQAIAASVAHAPSDLSLAEGSAGSALLLGCLPRLVDETDSPCRPSLAPPVTASLVLRDSDPSLYGGVLGWAWTMQHLGTPTGGLYATLSDLLAPEPWIRDFDLIAGLVGMGVYALGRLPHADALLCVERIVGHLSDLGEHDDAGSRWKTSQELLPDWHRQVAPDGCYDLGMAHGVAGVISFLGSVCAAGVASSTAPGLLEGAVGWLLHQRFPADDGPVFPAWVAAGVEPRRGPLHWCYGDPGVASALFVAAQGAGRPDWETIAVDIALHAARIGLARGRVANAGICHGSAGLAHVYNRFWQATGEPAFATAATTWLERTSDLLADTAESGFLEGRAGVGLVLLSALGLRPDWDAVLALSSPRPYRP